MSMPCRSMLHFWAITLCVVLLGLPSWAEVFEVTLLESVFSRESGPPVTQNVSFSVADPRAAYILTIHNDGLEDDNITGERVSSSVINLNGTEIVGSNSFNQQVTSIAVPIFPDFSNQLSIELRGKTGGLILIKLTGEFAIQITSPETGFVTSADTIEISETVSEQVSEVSFICLRIHVDKE